VRIIETEAYTFDELNDTAKERARQWWREGSFDYEWWDAVYEDAVAIAKILGIDINTKDRNWVNTSTGKSGTVKETCIYFSGFSSQGDGACFEGYYSYSKGWKKKLKAYAPTDKALFDIGEDLQAAQRTAQWSAHASCKNVGHYCHSGCMEVGVDWEEGANKEGEAYEMVSIIKQCMRDFADWIYKQLEAEYDYRNEDEQVDETILANEYEFTEEGVMI